MSSIIKVRNLEKKFANSEIETVALSGVNLDVNDGEFLAIMGPSGSGKTTLLNILGMLDHPTGGKYFFLDENISSLNEPQRVIKRKGIIGFIFQDPNLIDELTVSENIELPLYYLKIPAEERKAKVDAVLERMNISHKKSHFPRQLTVGQQQRVAIARALVTNPKIIMADEPTGNLDSVQGEEIMKLISMLNDEGVTIVMVTHSPYHANYAHRVINLFDGKIITENISEQFHI